MRKKIRPAFFAVAAVLLFSVFLAAQEKTPRFIGTEKCKMCHKSESRGNQYEKWSSSPHSKAFTVLATEHALKVAQDAGIKSNPQEAAECLKCHVTAYSAPASAKAESFSPDEGVGCEACHGPGSIYKSLNIMKALHAGTQDAEAVGFMRGGKETCLTCHNEKSPTYKPFKYEAFMKEIAHPIPEKE